MTDRIRPAALGDLSDLLGLEAASFVQNGLSRRAMRYMIQNPQARFLLLERGETVAGYGLMLEHKRAKAARLYSLAVGAAFRGAGVADGLLAHLETLCQKPVLKLEVRADNLRAQNFYIRQNYQSIGERDAYYADGMSAILMMKRL